MTEWRKSVRSMNAGNCVEVAADSGAVLVRDSRDPDGLVVRFPAEAWRAFGREPLAVGDRSTRNHDVAP